MPSHFDALRHRLAVRVLRWVHAVDHPVLAIGPEEHVAALHPLAVEDDHDLAVRPLLGLVRPVVPDRDVTRAVVAGRDVAPEVDVVERVVLDVNGEVVLLGVGGHAFGHRPRDENAIPFEPEIPVQAARVMLLHHKPRRLGRFPGNLGAGFWCLLEIALGLVLGELFGHLRKG